MTGPALNRLESTLLASTLLVMVSERAKATRLATRHVLREVAALPDHERETLLAAFRKEAAPVVSINRPKCDGCGRRHEEDELTQFDVLHLCGPCLLEVKP